MTAQFGTKFMDAGALRAARERGEQIALRQIAETGNRAIAAGYGTHAIACGTAM